MTICRTVRGLALALILTLSFPLWAHNTAHDYSIVSNGVIELSREAESGGSVVWLSEVGGPNVINNADLGRQIQAAFHAQSNYTPTQAGDGPNPAGCETFHVGDGYTYSRSVPLLFWDGVCTNRAL